ncbi:MAG: LysR family transcriptional regulator [Comamonadaceae bacterium]|nr:LysR family transcriptional regulator [Comamonadaceae bacterium]
MAVLRRIAELERGIGLRLFNHPTRRVDLAEAAQMRGCTTPGIRALSEQGQ